MMLDVVGTEERAELPPCALTPPAPPAGDDFSVSSKSIQDSFQVWLEGMTGGARGKSPARALTPREIGAVTLATVREGCKHRRWPREIVERFLATEVVTRTPASRPTGREANAAARRYSLLRIPGGGYATIANILRR